MENVSFQYSSLSLLPLLQEVQAAFLDRQTSLVSRAQLLLVF